MHGAKVVAESLLAEAEEVEGESIVAVPVLVQDSCGDEADISGGGGRCGSGWPASFYAEVAANANAEEERKRMISVLVQQAKAKAAALSHENLMKIVLAGEVCDEDEAT